MKNSMWFAAAHPTHPIRAIGIDLGTTNSVVAEIQWSPGDSVSQLPTCHCLPIAQPTAEGVVTSVLVPSMLAILPNKQHRVGEGAKRLRNRPQTTPLKLEANLFYDTKNEMGLRKTYYRAPEAYNHASKIAGHILQFLREATAKPNAQALESVVITVPASFQVNQRRDTLLAAQQAGFSLQEHQLLDEPTAALLDYLFTHPNSDALPTGRTVRCVLFDFGGGTCDVAIVDLRRDPQTDQFEVAPHAVSRYHRLGGGDIDLAIVHEHLIPMLLKEQKLTQYDLTWAQKKRVLEPQLLGTAEALKLAMCAEVERLQLAEQYRYTKKESVVVYESAVTCHVGDKKLLLARPTLNASEWEQIVAPFLDSDHPYAQETEFRLTQSLFAPLSDALQRAKLDKEDIDICLLVGGSSLIPQVQTALMDYLPTAKVCLFDNPLDMQTAVARGAAWHAFYLAVTGQPLVRPVLHDGIALLTHDKELYTLIPAGASIPYPSDGSFLCIDELALPDVQVNQLNLEFRSTSTQQLLFTALWTLPPNTPPGADLTVEISLSKTQELVCRAYLTDSPDAPFECEIQNPLCHVVNPNDWRQILEEMEEELRAKGGGVAEDRSDIVDVAKLHATLGQFEKALDFLRHALRILNHPDAEILNLQGLYYGDLRDYQRQERAYLEADKADPRWAGPLFNLAISYRKQKRHSDALDAINRALIKDPESAPYHVLRGQCLQALERNEEAQETFETALELFNTPAGVSEWELGWLKTCAEVLRDKSMLYQVMKEREQRKLTLDAPTQELIRPVVRPRPTQDEFSF